MPTRWTELVRSLGNAGAVANAEACLARARHDDELVAALLATLGVEDAVLVAAAAAAGRRTVAA